jgi:hypothetical protein
MAQQVHLNQAADRSGKHCLTVFHFVDYLIDVLTQIQNYLQAAVMLVGGLFNIAVQVFKPIGQSQSKFQVY